MEKFSQILNYLLHKSNRTNKDLAAHLDMTPQNVSRWVNDRGFPSIPDLIKIAVFFDVSVDELLGRSSLSFEGQSYFHQKKSKDEVKTEEQLALAEARIKILEDQLRRYEDIIKTAMRK